jgi:hypothetical protein
LTIRGRWLAQALCVSSHHHLITDGISICLEDQHEHIIDILKSARQPMFLVCVSDQARGLTAIGRKPVCMEPALAVRSAFPF